MRIVDFHKGFQGFRETVQRSRPGSWPAGDDNAELPVFLRFSIVPQLFSAFARSFSMNIPANIALETLILTMISKVSRKPCSTLFLASQKLL